MSYINKNSLRGEFDTLKSDFEQLSKKEKLSPEFLTLFKALFMLFELMMAVFMEKKTVKDNKNSGKPSSQTEKDNTSISSHIGSNKKQRQENTAHFDSRRSIETLEVATVDTCDTCGENLSKIAPQNIERRTKIDIIFEKVVTHIDAEIKICPDCQVQTKGLFPSNMPGPLQYGLGVKSYALNLLIAQMVALNRIQAMLKTLLGELISEATLLNYVMSLNQALEIWEKQSVDVLQTSSSLHLDETSMRVNKKTQWIHVYSSGYVTLKFLRINRSIEAIESIGIISDYHGVMVHDCLPAYLSYEKKNHVF